MKEIILRPDHYPQLDLFVCDLVDIPFKSDQASLMHPVFTLSNKPDYNPRIYHNKGETMKVTANSEYGLATIFDRDILLYCISQSVEAQNRGLKAPQSLVVNSKNLMIAINRQSSGTAYKALYNSFRRLKGTMIETNISNGGKVRTNIFGLLESVEVIRQADNGRIIDVEVKLPDWIMDAIEGRSILTMHKNYFRLSKPLERRFYEVARKLCGNREHAEIGLKEFQIRCGSKASLREFKRLVSKVIDKNLKHKHIPQFEFILTDNGNKEAILHIYPNQEYLEKKLSVKDSNIATLTLRVNPDTINNAKRFFIDGDADYYLKRWRAFVKKNNITVKSPNDHFYTFCKNAYVEQQNIKKKQAARK